MKPHRLRLSRLAGLLIAASVAAGFATVFARILANNDSVVQILEAVTLFLAAGAYLAYAWAHHKNHRELVTRSILVSAFALWAIVQLAPGDIDIALLNDVVILLFVADLAVLLSPWQ